MKSENPIQPTETPIPDSVENASSDTGGGTFEAQVTIINEPGSASEESPGENASGDPSAGGSFEALITVIGAPGGESGAPPLPDNAPDAPAAPPSGNPPPPDPGQEPVGEPDNGANALQQQAGKTQESLMGLDQAHQQTMDALSECVEQLKAKNAKQERAIEQLHALFERLESWFLNARFLR